jgi:mannose-6-phosphate isomerase-like protein (cupin superfamily)
MRSGGDRLKTRLSTPELRKPDMKIVRAADGSFIPASHENPLAPGVWKKILFEKASFQLGQIQMVNWARLPVGHAFAAHYHEDMQEVFIIVQGVAEMTVAGQSAELGRGDAILIDAGEVHRMRNLGGDDVEYVVFGVASGHDGRTVVVP